jgi:hypothetical protein
MNPVRKTAIKALTFFCLGVVLGVAGNIIVVGRHPRQNVLLGVIIAIPFCVTALVFALRAMWRSFKEQNLDGLTLLLARGALPLIILSGIVLLGIVLFQLMLGFP